MADDPRGLRSHFDALIGTEWLDDDPEHARAGCRSATSCASRSASCTAA